MEDFSNYMKCFESVSKGLFRLRPLSPEERDTLKKGFYSWYEYDGITLNDHDLTWSKAANLYGRDTLVWLV